MQPGERHIYERGCLRAGEEWIESNLVPVAAVKVGVMVLQVYFQLINTLHVSLSRFFFPNVFVILFSVLLFLCAQNYDVSKIINERGCLEAIEDWIEKNMISIASCTFIILFFEVSFSCFSKICHLKNGFFVTPF